MEMEARFLRESLQKSQATTDRMVMILGSLDRRLSALDTAMRPTQMDTDSLGEVCGNLDKVLSSANEILSRFYLSREAETIIQKGPREDLQAYMRAMDQLRNNLHFFDSKKTFRNRDRIKSHINSLLVQAILMIEEEFRHLLSAYSHPVDRHLLVEISANQQSENQVEPDAESLTADKRIYKLPVLIPARTLPSLHDLALQMVQNGTFQECVRAFKESHGTVLERTLRLLGIEKKEDVQRMSLEALDAKITVWIDVIPIAIKSLFVGEKQLCHEIFHDIDSLENLCFGAAIETSVDMLLSFGYAVAKREWPPEKLFSLLSMHKVLHGLHPEIETLFDVKSCSKMRLWVLNLTKQLTKTVRTIITGFENKIAGENIPITTSDCAVHSITSYVSNYVKYLGVDYRAALDVIYDETGAVSVTMRILNAVVSKLEEQSQKYHDPALRHLFLMNNINHIVSKVRISNAQPLVGEDWVPRHRKIVQQNANQYRRVAWMPILQVISTQSVNSTGGSMGGMLSSGVSKSAIKEKFKLFNTQFEDLIHKQSQWNVRDKELRESLRLSVAEVLLPAYTHFVKSLGPAVERSKNQEKFWKYKPDDVSQMIGSLFQGGPVTHP